MKLIDLASIALLLIAAGAFSMGVLALGDRRDLPALYWLAMGALSLKAATDMLRPRSGTRL